MARKLRRRSLTLEPAKSTIEQNSQIDDTEITQSDDDPEITVDLLTSIPGIGKTVAERVVDTAPKVSRIFGRWKNAGAFAAQIKGLSAAGASKIWDKVRATYPHLAPKPPSRPSQSTVTTSVDDNHHDNNNENKITLPPPYDKLPDAQLEALLPNLTGDIRDAVEAHLYPTDEDDYIEESEEETENEEEEDPPKLPPGFDGLTNEQLYSMLPSLQGEIHDQITKFLHWSNSETLHVQKPTKIEKPIDNTEEVKQTIRKAVVSALPQKPTNQSSSSVTDILGFFKTEANRYNKGSDGSRIPYLKLTSGQNKIRLLGPYKSGVPPFRLMKLHTYKEGNRLQFAMDYNWLRSDESFVRYLLEEGKIEEDDISCATRLGDPMQELPRRLDAAGRRDECKNLWARTRYLWNIIDRTSGNLMVWESSRTFFDQIAMLDDDGNLVGGLLSVYPDLFDSRIGRDIQINGNGADGRERRYSAPIALEPTPTGIPDDQTLYNLDEVAARKVRSWEDKCTALFAVSGRLAASVGMMPQDWMGQSKL